MLSGLCDWFIFWYQFFHDYPADKISHGTDGEDDKVPGFFALKTGTVKFERFRENRQRISVYPAI